MLVTSTPFVWFSRLFFSLSQTYRSDVRRTDLLVDVATEEARFADAAVAEEKQFEKDVVVFRHFDDRNDKSHVFRRR